jgi:hypothetical protein
MEDNQKKKSSLKMTIQAVIVTAIWLGFALFLYHAFKK